MPLQPSCDLEIKKMNTNEPNGNAASSSTVRVEDVGKQDQTDTLMRPPRRVAMNNFRREGTGYVPRERSQQQYEEILAMPTVGKRSGQRLVQSSAEGMDPTAFFELNNQNFQQVNKDDQSSVMSLSNITINDSDSAISMLSTKTGYSLAGSSGEEKTLERTDIKSTATTNSEPMEDVTSSEDDGSTRKLKPTKRVDIDTPRPRAEKSLEVSHIEPIIYQNDFMETGGLDYQDGSAIADHIFPDEEALSSQHLDEPSRKKTKHSYESESEGLETIQKAKVTTYSTEEEDDEWEREYRRQQKARQTQRSTQSESEGEASTISQNRSEYSYNATPSASAPGVQRDFYPEEAEDYSQRDVDYVVQEKYVHRKELINQFPEDDTDDEETNFIQKEVYEDDEAFVPDASSELPSADTTILGGDLSQDFKFTQYDDIDNPMLGPFGLTEDNILPSKLRKRVTKPCKFWENERPLPKETGKLAKIKPNNTEPVRKIRETNGFRQPKKDLNTSIIEQREGEFTVFNSDQKEVEMKIAATSDMCTESHFRFKRDDREPSRYKAERLDNTNASRAHLSMFSHLSSSGISAGNLTVQPGGVKPSSNSEYHSEIFYCLSGSVLVKINDKNPLITLKRGSVLHVPPFNSYSMKNTNKKTPCKLFYVFATMIDEEEEEEDQMEENADKTKQEDQLLDGIPEE